MRNQGSSRRIRLLTDIPAWVNELRQTLVGRGYSVDVVDVTTIRWEPSEDLAWSDTLVFNRISANTGGGRVSTLTKARDLLASLHLAGVRVVNGLPCQLISSSKALQATVFCQANVKTPRTEFLELHETLRPSQKTPLTKPNVSGFGKGITAVSSQTDSATYSEDGCAILQDHVKSGDNLVHRVELLGGQVLYRSTTALRDEHYNYCLAGVKQVELYPDCPVDITKACQRIAEVAAMDVGSVEYLLDAEQKPWFIDINPVSTYSPQAMELLGFSPLEKLADFLHTF